MKINQPYNYKNITEINTHYCKYKRNFKNNFLREKGIENPQNIHIKNLENKVCINRKFIILQ